MSMTPGPWFFGQYAEGGCFVEQKDGDPYPIAVADEIVNPDNARAIAALPDLVEALKALDHAFMAHTFWNGDPPFEIVQSRAALNKAGVTND